MRGLALALLAAIVVAQAVALPLTGPSQPRRFQTSRVNPPDAPTPSPDEGTQLQTSMFNAGDDETTLTQEVNEVSDGAHLGKCFCHLPSINSDLVCRQSTASKLACRVVRISVNLMPWVRRAQPIGARRRRKRCAKQR